MTRRAHTLIFAGVMVGYTCALILAAQADPPQNIKIEFKQCCMQIGDWPVIWNPAQKNLPPDLKAATCWTVTSMADQPTVDYYAMIGAKLERKKKK